MDRIQGLGFFCGFPLVFRAFIMDIVNIVNIYSAQKKNEYRKIVIK